MATIDNQYTHDHEEAEEEEEEDDFYDNSNSDDHTGMSNVTSLTSGLSGLSGWQLAARGIELALNNRIEDAQVLLKVDSSCIHRQAGYCYLTFIVSCYMCYLP